MDGHINYNRALLSGLNNICLNLANKQSYSDIVAFSLPLKELH